MIIYAAFSKYLYFDLVYLVRVIMVLHANTKAKKHCGMFCYLNSKYFTALL